MTYSGPARAAPSWEHHAAWTGEAASREPERTATRQGYWAVLLLGAMAVTAVTGVLGGPDESDGVLPEGVTVFDDEYPAVAKLDPGLRKALRAAAGDAARDGVELYVNSGWRSAAYQNQLLRDAVDRYGSRQEAARWVATPDTSAHVSGDAADVGPDQAAAWLSKHGRRYGLCQIYRNEPWHFELRPRAADRGCPPPYADPTRDPRTRK